MIKILHLSTELTWRGGENQTRLLIEGLKQYGVISYLAAPKKSVIYLYFKENIPCFDFSTKTIPLIGQALEIANYCRKEKIDLIDAQTSKAHSIALLVSYFYPSIKIIVHRRVDYPPSSNLFSQFKYRSARISRFVAISDAIGKVLRDFGLEQSKVTVVKSAIDGKNYENQNKQQAKESLCQELGISSSTLLIGNGSALSEQKGYDTLLQSLALLRSHHPLLDFYVPIAGDGPLMSELKRLCSQLKLDDKVRFLGHRKDMANFLSALDILAMPSKDEGLGTLIQEAIHSGACVVATAVGGIPEMILHEKTGLLSPKADPEAFATQLERVCFSKELREQLTVEAKRFIKERFSVTSMVEGNLSVYKEILRLDI